ncbi:MAG: N-acetyl-alpha-D-glucosaminyl L-malate synthase BshA [Bacteroidota bacterium]
MKIGITCYPTYGGSGVIATELGKALAKRGHEIHFICYAIPMRLNEFSENIFYHEVEISQYPLFEFPLYTPALASKMTDVALFKKLDLLHVHYAIPHATSAYLAREIVGRDQLKIITTLHGTDITLVGLEPSYLAVMKFSIEQSDGVTAVSHFLREQTLTNYNIHKEIEVIPNFVDFHKYRRIDSDSCRESVAPNGEKVLIHVSNFRPVKRVPDVIKIFEIVHRSIPSRLLLVGDGPERSSCELLSYELGINNDVLFLGKQADLVRIYSASDLMLMPSQSESFGLAALEAMACEVPVVSSNAGGLPELVVHGVTGYMSEVGNIEQMAHHAIELLTNEKKRRKFARAARQPAVEHFPAGKIVEQYEAYYEKVLGKSNH